MIGLTLISLLAYLLLVLELLTCFLSFLCPLEVEKIKSSKMADLAQILIIFVLIYCSITCLIEFINLCTTSFTDPDFGEIGLFIFMIVILQGGISLFLNITFYFPMLARFLCYYHRFLPFFLPKFLFAPLVKRAVRNKNPAFYKMLEMLFQVDVNEADEEGNTAFQLACRHGNVEIVQLFLKNPRVNLQVVNWRLETPFFEACDNGKIEVIKLLLADPQVDVNRRNIFKQTPFGAAFDLEAWHIVDLLLASHRIYPFKRLEYTERLLEEKLAIALVQHPHFDLRKLWEMGWDPEFILFQLQQNSAPFQHLLISHPTFKLPLVLYWWGGKGLGYLARVGNMQAVKYLLATNYLFPSLDIGLVKRLCPHPQILELVLAYEKNPDQIREKLQIDLGLNDVMAARIFICLVMYCDGYFALKGKRSDDKIHQFFRIGLRLPMEIQMILSNIVAGLTKITISVADIDRALVWILWKLGTKHEKVH